MGFLSEWKIHVYVIKYLRDGPVVKIVKHKAMQCSSVWVISVAT